MPGMSRYPAPPPAGAQMAVGGPPPADGMGPPPAGGMVPPPGGPPTPDDAMALQDENANAKVEALMQGRPTPDKPYSVAAVKTLADQASAAVDKIAGAEIPLPEWEPESGAGGKLVDPETKEPMPLPGEVYLPVAVLSEAIRAVDTDGDFEKYLFDPAELTDDGQLKLAASKLKMASGDKALATALMGPQGGSDADKADKPGPPGKPEDMSEDDAALAENM